MLSESAENKRSSGRFFGLRGRAAGLFFAAGMGFVFIYVFPHLRFLEHANEMPRLFLAEALAQSGDYHIDKGLQAHGYRKQMDISKSLCLGTRLARLGLRSAGGHRAARRATVWSCREKHYSNKAPAQSVLAVPFLWLAEGWAGLQGREPTLAEELWWARLGTSVLPTWLLLFMVAAVLAGLMRERLPRRAAVAAYGVGSLAFVYGLQLMSHQLAAASLFGAFFFVHTGRDDWRRLAVSGLLAGVAIASDYQAAFGAALVAFYALFAVGLRPRVVWGLVGGMLPLAFLAHYHDACFGSPFWTGYEFLVARSDQALHEAGVLGMIGPRARPFWASFFSARDGLVFFSPWTVFAIPGLAILLGAWGRGAWGRSRGRRGPESEGDDGDSSSEGGDATARSWWVASWQAVVMVVAGVGAYLGLSAAAGAPRPAVEPYLTASGWAAGLLGVCGVGLGLLSLSSFSKDRPGRGGRASMWALAVDRLFRCLVISLGLAAPALAGLASHRAWHVFFWTIISSWTHLRPGGAGAGGHRGLRWAGIAGLLLGGYSALFLALPASAASGDAGMALRLIGWVAAALWAAAGAFSSSEPRLPRSETGLGLVLFAVIAFYVWFVSSLTFWHGGWQVGPRYLAVMLPFLTIAAGVGFMWFWNRGVWWAPVAGTILVGMAVHLAAGATFPHFPKSFKNPLFGLVGYLLERGYVARNLGEWVAGLEGLTSLAPYFAVGAALGIYVACGRRAFGRWRPDSGRRIVVGALAFCVAISMLGAYSRLERVDFERCCRWITERWDRELEQRRRELEQRRRELEQRR